MQKHVLFLHRTGWYALEYVEHESRKGFVPDGESEYVTLVLVSQVEQSGAGDRVVVCQEPYHSGIMPLA